ncbi:MAG: HupE/UreJ family protein [Bacteroidota bacterium]
MKKLLFTFGILSFSPQLLLAHGGHGTGFVAGLTHPIFGLDHLIAIVGASVLGYALLTQKQWLPSLAFVLAMIVGGVLGVEAEAIYITEWIIVLSVLITGFLIAFEIQVPFLVYGLLYALFGFFHGHAHGTEMPAASNIWWYVLGFVAGVAILSGLGRVLTKLIRQPVHTRLLGAFMAGMGLMMLLA